MTLGTVKRRIPFCRTFYAKPGLQLCLASLELILASLEFSVSIQNMDISDSTPPQPTKHLHFQLFVAAALSSRQALHGDDGEGDGRAGYLRVVSYGF